MPSEDYIRHIEQQLRDVDAKLVSAKAALAAEGDIESKARDLEEWSRLKLRHEELEKRVEDAKRANPEDWSDLHTSFREEVDALVDTMERWLTRLS